MNLSHSAAIAAIALAAQTTLAGAIGTLTPVVTTSSGPTIGSETLSDIHHVVIDNDGNVATLSSYSDIDDSRLTNEVVTLHLINNGNYDSSIVATNTDALPANSGSAGSFGTFENLALTDSGSSTVVFSSPSSQSRTGIFKATTSSAPSSIFYSPSTSSGKTLNTTGFLVSPVPYGIGSNGAVSFGTLNNTGGIQNLNLNSATSPLDTGNVQDFNRTSDTSRYLVKTVPLSDGSVMAIGQAPGSGTGVGYGLYQVTATGASTPTQALYGTVNGYQPRQLLGATASQSIVVGVNPANNDAETNGAIVYVNNGVPTTLKGGINAGDRVNAANTTIYGQMSASGKAAVYVASEGILYHDPSVTGSDPTPLQTGDTVTGANGNQTITGFGLDGLGATPMLNDNGWIVTGATVAGTPALIAWNPALGLTQTIAEEGDEFQLPEDPNTYTIYQLTEAERNVDTDILKDGLNDLNQVAFGVSYTDQNDNFGYAVLTTTLVPEPASLTAFGLAGVMLLRRRRAGTPS